MFDNYGHVHVNSPDVGGQPTLWVNIAFQMVSFPPLNDLVIAFLNQLHRRQNLILL